MPLIKWITKWITDDRIYIRVVSMYISFFLTYYVALVGSYFLLPEGIFRGKHPIISRIELSDNPYVLTFQIFSYNLVPSFLIIGANLLAQQSKLVKEKSIPIGYTAFFSLTVLFGMITGTWSFDVVTAAPSLGSRVFRLLDIAHNSGLLEFSGYLLLAVTSFRFTLWYSDRKKIIRSRSWKEVELPTFEKVIFASGFVILLIAALVEAQGIIQTAK